MSYDQGRIKKAIGQPNSSDSSLSYATVLTHIYMLKNSRESFFKQDLNYLSS